MLEPRNILVRGPNWTGDLVMATPSFRALRERFPAARITLLLRTGLKELLAGAPWFDELLEMQSYHGGARALLREAVSLRRRRFDLGVCLPDSFSSALLLRLAGVRPCLGYRRGVRGFLLDLKPEWPQGKQTSGNPLGREVEGGLPGGRMESDPFDEDAGDGAETRQNWIARERHVLALLRSLGCWDDDTRLELFTTSEEERAVDELLAKHELLSGRPLAVLAPGASYGSSKLWPAASFAEVGDRLYTEGVAVAVAGAPAERELAERVVGAMRAPAACLAGELRLGTLKALLRRARLLVCNDAGARHIAVAFGVPCVVLMGPTSLLKTNLNLERVQVLTADVPCRPCYLRECPIDHRCMTRIEPKRVAEAALAALISPIYLRAGSGRAESVVLGTRGERS